MMPPMPKSMTKAEIDGLRRQYEGARQALDAAKLHAERARERLFEATAKRAGVSRLYIELLDAVLQNPVSGHTHPRFGRILHHALRKEVVRPNQTSQARAFTIPGCGSCTTNRWMEPGALGQQIIQDLRG